MRPGQAGRDIFPAEAAVHILRERERICAVIRRLSDAVIGAAAEEGILIRAADSAVERGYGAA